MGIPFISSETVVTTVCSGHTCFFLQYRLIFPLKHITHYTKHHSSLLSAQASHERSNCGFAIMHTIHDALLKTKMPGERGRDEGDEGVRE